MNKQFVTYEIALKLKEMGFDESCFGYYERKNNHRIWFEMPNKGMDSIPIDDVLAPLWQQCLDFLEDKYGLLIQIEYNSTMKFWRYDIFSYTKEHDWESENGLKSKLEAKESAVLKAIKLIYETRIN